MAKAFAWSFSKLTKYETCPRRLNEIDNLKNFSDSGGDALVWGNKVHDAFHKALKNSTPLPPDMTPYQKWIDRLRAGAGELMVEQKFALTKDFQPTEWFSPFAWYRGICDCLRINGNVALAIDWKTGGIKPDSVQLMLMAACIFAFHPEVKLVRTKFVWLQDDCETTEDYTRNDVAGGWVGLLERIGDLEHAFKTNNYPPRKSGLCFKYCPVVTCEHNGRRKP